MALVMLPCDLPWWPSVVKKLQNLQECTNLDGVIEIMQQIHNLCNVSLDPEEDKHDPTIFYGLHTFLKNDLNQTELSHFISSTLKNIVNQALCLKLYKPPKGLIFSLQQQSDSVEINYNFSAALLANAFFSTFPKRTDITHPTLQDFNFTHFFTNLEAESQKVKLLSIFHYFDWINENTNDDGGCMKVSRKVMNGRQWLTIEDWLESSTPLCSLNIKHERKIETTTPDIVQTIFASSHLGGKVLFSGDSQECFHFSTFPDILSILLFVEALEDNESMYIENARQFTRINNLKLEKLDVPKKVSLILMDAENYKQYPLNQYEEDDILRELNKCLLAFRQNTINFNINKCDKLSKPNSLQKRLSPIGESSINLSKDPTIVIRQPSSSTKRSSYDSEKIGNDIAGRRSWLCTNNNNTGGKSESSLNGSSMSNSRGRGRFIVLGSSGECLPITRNILLPNSDTNNSLYSSCDSGSENYFSAKTSLDKENDSDEELSKEQKHRTENSDRRYTFAEKLRAALHQSNGYSDSLDSSYAVGISISGSRNEDEGIRIRRGRSTGFMLNDDSIDKDFNYALAQKYQHDKSLMMENGVENNNESQSSSPLYSFSTDYSTDNEDFNEQLKQILGNNLANDIDPRNEEVISFASSLLKRTLSESFVGVPLTDGCVTSIAPQINDMDVDDSTLSHKIKLGSRSLSLELAKHKHRLAGQLISKIAIKYAGISGLKPIATGNWGCGKTLNGDTQLKMIIQWMAASFAGLPYLMYYTAGNEKLSKMDTLGRVLLDRKWSVGELTAAILNHAKELISNPFEATADNNNQCIFEKLIGI